MQLGKPDVGPVVYDLVNLDSGRPIGPKVGECRAEGFREPVLTHVS
jgi:hypothetical protein